MYKFLITFYHVITKDFHTYESEGYNKEDAAANLSVKMDKEGKQWRSILKFQYTQPKIIPQPLSIKEFKEYKELNKKIFKGAKFVEFTKEEEESVDCKRYDELCKRKMYCLACGIHYVIGEQILI